LQRNWKKRLGLTRGCRVNNVDGDVNEVEVKLRPTVSWRVRRGVRHPSRTRDQFLFLLEIFFRQLRVCYFVAPSLTRGRICNLLLLLLLDPRPVPLGSESRGTQDHILLSQFLRLPQPGRPGPHIYIPQEQGGPVIPPGTGFPFHRLLRLTRLRWRYSIPPSHGMMLMRTRSIFKACRLCLIILCTKYNVHALNTVSS
jgi:hypothetical protein